MEATLQEIVDRLESWEQIAGYCPMSGSVYVTIDENTDWWFGTADGENWGADLNNHDGIILRSIEKIGVDADCEDPHEIASAILDVVTGEFDKEKSLSPRMYNLTKAVDNLKADLDNAIQWMQNSEHYRNLHSKKNGGNDTPRITQEWDDRDGLNVVQLVNIMEGTSQAIQNIFSR